MEEAQYLEMLEFLAGKVFEEEIKVPNLYFIRQMRQNYQLGELYMSEDCKTRFKNFLSRFKGIKTDV